MYLTSFSEITTRVNVFQKKIPLTSYKYSSVTQDSWDFVGKVTYEASGDNAGVYYNGVKIATAAATNVDANTTIAGDAGNLTLTVTGAKVQYNTSNSPTRGLLVKNTPLSIANITGAVKLTVAWQTAGAKTDRSLSVKVGSATAVTTVATGATGGQEPAYTVNIDAGTGTTVAIGGTNDLYITSITISAQD